VLPTAVAGTVTLVQALEEVGLVAPLWIVTRDGVDRPEPAQCLGPRPGRRAGVPAALGGLVDLPEWFDDRAATRLAAVLAVRPGREDQVVIRPSGTLARRLERRPRHRHRYLTPRGTVLVHRRTGALGARVACGWRRAARSTWS